MKQKQNKKMNYLNIVEPIKDMFNFIFDYLIVEPIKDMFNFIFDLLKGGRNPNGI